MFADLAQLTDASGHCFELFNRERAAVYARRLGIRLGYSPDDAIAGLIGATYSDPVTDGMFWADTTTADLVAGFIPLSFIGLTGTTVAQQVVSTADGWAVIAGDSSRPRPITIEGVIVGLDCCAVSEYKRRLNGWLTDCLSSAGYSLRLLTCLPETKEFCNDPLAEPGQDPYVVEIPAEWITLRNLALTAGVTETGRVSQADGCQRCGGSTYETVRFTFTAADHHLYHEPVPVAEVTGLTFPVSGVRCNIDKVIRSVCCPTEQVSTVADKEALPVRMKLDGTACPIGWDLIDWDPVRQYLYPAVLDEGSGTKCKPYRVKLNIDIDGETTSWTPINPARWALGLPSDCDIIVSEITYPNPDYEPLCPDCPGFEYACLEEYGMVLDGDRFIDGAASGIIAGTYDFAGPDPTLPGWLSNYLDFLSCLGVKHDGNPIRDIESIWNDASVAPTSPEYFIRITVTADGLLSIEIINQEFFTMVCEDNAYVWEAPGLGYTGPGAAPCHDDTDYQATPFPLESDCGNIGPEHCQEFLTTVIDRLGDPQSAECFFITLNDDEGSTWSHDGWDFETDGIPPDYGHIFVNPPVVAEEDACAGTARQCNAIVTVGESGITWTTDGTWSYIEANGFPEGCTLVFSNHSPGVYEVSEAVPIGGCDRCRRPSALDCIVLPCSTPSSPTIPDPGEPCGSCSTPIVGVYSQRRIVAPGQLGRPVVPRFILDAGSDPLKNFEIRVWSDPLKSALLRDLDGVPILDENEMPLLRDDLHTIFSDCDLCAHLGVSYLPGDAMFELDVQGRRANLFCNGDSIDGRSLLYGLHGGFDWDQWVFGCDDLIVSFSANAIEAGLDGEASDPARWSMWLASREVG